MRFIDMTGEEINGFLCLKELGSNKVYVKCVKCGREFEARKLSWKKSEIACKNPNCEKYGYAFIDMTGKEISGFLCLKDLGHNKLFVKCTNCGKEFEAFKSSWKKGILTCRNLNCVKYKSTRFLDMTGEEVNGFICFKELGYNKVLVRCRNCGVEFETCKEAWKAQKSRCPNCDLRKGSFRTIEGHTIRNVVVINFAYLGRDNVPYYFCNTLSGKRIEFPLSYSELFTFKEN